MSSLRPGFAHTFPPVYAFGSAEKGQLGNGTTGEHIVTGGKLVYDAESEPCMAHLPTSLRYLG